MVNSKTVAEREKKGLKLILGNTNPVLKHDSVQDT